MSPFKTAFLLVLISPIRVEGESAVVDICDSQLCECYEDVSNCQWRNLSSVAGTLVIPKYVAKVDFSNNLLSNLEDLDVDVIPELLEYLDLSSNAVIKLPPQSLKVFNTSVKTLYLKNNMMQEIHQNSFANLSSLIKLDLSFNKISALPNGIFDDLVNLKFLDLSFNPIQNLGEATFMHLKALKELNLSFLQLLIIHPDIFDWNLTITHLNLGYNYFTSIPSKALWYLRDTLQSMELSGNLFETIPEGSFFGLHRLETLKMEQLLYLRHIEAHAFNDLESLATLVLRYLPQISKIDEQAFQLTHHSNETDLKLCPLRDFTLQFSTLSYLPENLLMWDQLRYADLRNNRWICDCYMRWMKGTALEELTRNTFYCWAPLKHRGKNLHYLQEKDFTCDIVVLDTKSGAIAILVIVILAMVVSFLTVIVLVYRRNGWVFNPPRMYYDKVDSQLNSITIFDRATPTTSTAGDREMVIIHD